MVDTGFTGHVTLPAGMVRSLTLPRRGFVEVDLAEGTPPQWESMTLLV